MVNAPSKNEEPVAWKAIKRKYEKTRKSVWELAKDFGLSGRVLEARISKYGWARKTQARTPAESEAKPLTQMLSEIGRQLLVRIGRQIDERHDGAANQRLPAEIRTLLPLVERIARLEGKDPNANPGATPRIVDDARRLELARRLEGLRRQIEFEEAQEAAERASIE